MRTGRSTPAATVTGPDGGHRRRLRAALIGIRRVLPRLVSRARRLSIAYPRAVRSWTLAGILGSRLVRILIRILLARILARALVGRLVLVLRRTIRRRDLSILRIGRRPRRAPIARLARRRGLLPRGLRLRGRPQGRGERQACAQRPRKNPLQTISLDQIHPQPPCPGKTPDPPARTYCIDGERHSPSQVLTLFYGKSYAGLRPSRDLLPMVALA